MPSILKAEPFKMIKKVKILAEAKGKPFKLRFKALQLEGVRKALPSG
jgi:hypothetical protein